MNYKEGIASIIEMSNKVKDKRELIDLINITPIKFDDFLEGQLDNKESGLIIKTICSKLELNKESVFFLFIEEEDIPLEKRGLFKILKEPIQEFIKDIVAENSKDNA